MHIRVEKAFSFGATPTCMTLELADRSISQPIGIAKDVDVKVGKFQFPADFVVVDFDADPRGFDILIEVSDASLLSKMIQLTEFDDSYYDLEGDILLLEAFLNDDPSLPPLTQGNYLPKIQKELKVKLKDLPPHLEYAFLEGDDNLPVIIAKDLSVEEKAALLKVLKSHKRAIAWKLSDIKGTNPEFCTYKILMEEDYKPAVQHQRRVNPKIHDVIKKEVEKLLDAGLIYPISDILGKDPVHVILKKDILKVRRHQSLSLNWEKSHFMVKEGIVLGHKISKNRIEVDKAKVDVIAKLPHPTTVKKKLTEAPILIAPDWDLPFELMCDASDFAIGAVLGQRHEKHFRPTGNGYQEKDKTKAKPNETEQGNEKSARN
ncbi:reverse transcriptase domain-containing protein [Tanacetum coccineum]